MTPAPARTHAGCAGAARRQPAGAHRRRQSARVGLRAGAAGSAISHRRQPPICTSSIRRPERANFAGAGTRSGDLEAEILTEIHEIAASVSSRRPDCRRCSRRWTANEPGGRRGPLFASGERVEFSGSQLVWEYYPGQGIELQILGNFGKADGLYSAGPAQYPR